MDPWWASFFMFALAMSLTPGPNNVMVTASGANFGFRRTIPHQVGIAAGVPVMLVSIGFAYDTLVSLVPEIARVMTVLGSAYLLYLAWRIATARPEATTGTRSRPLNMLEAALFQWINPKAWMIALSAYATYGDGPYRGLWLSLAMSAAFFAACLPSVALWTVGGVWIGRLLGRPERLRLFNLSMAGLLVLSLALAFV
jgi:threonine/homoserine/homoserine lactone efflux protein